MKLVILWQSLSQLHCEYLSFFRLLAFKNTTLEASRVLGHIQSPKIIHHIALNYHWAVRVQLKDG